MARTVITEHDLGGEMASPEPGHAPKVPRLPEPSPRRPTPRTAAMVATGLVLVLAVFALGRLTAPSPSSLLAEKDAEIRAVQASSTAAAKRQRARYTALEEKRSRDVRAAYAKGLRTGRNRRATPKPVAKPAVRAPAVRTPVTPPVPPAGPTSGGGGGGSDHIKPPARCQTINGTTLCS